MTLASASFSRPRSDHFVTPQGCQTLRSMNVATSAARSALHIQQCACFGGDDLNHPEVAGQRGRSRRFLHWIVLSAVQRAQVRGFSQALAARTPRALRPVLTDPTRSSAIARTDHRRHHSVHARRKNLTELRPHYCLSSHTRSDSHNIGVGQWQKAAGHVADPLSTFPTRRRGQKLSRCKADVPRQDIDDVETCADFASLYQADVRLCHAGSAGQCELRHIFGLASADQILTQHLPHRARGYTGANSLAFGWRWHVCQIPDSATLPPISACLDRNRGGAPEALQRSR